jgi:hypothetical protein
MKQSFYCVLIFFSFCLAHSAQNAEPTFTEFKLKDLGTIQIPATMELQGGDYKRMSDTLSKQKGFEISGDEIIFQQKGLNNFDFENNKTYARVMIGTDHDMPGSFNKLTARITATPAELREYDALLKEGTIKGFRESGTGLELVDWYGSSNVLVNGRNAIKTSFLRRLNQNPKVYVEVYLFQNYDRTHRLTISYRLEDSALWKAALERTKNSFTITNIRGALLAQQPTEPDRTFPKLSVYRDALFPFSIMYDSSEWEVVPSSYSDGRFRIANKPLMGIEEFNILVRKLPITTTEAGFLQLYEGGKAEFIGGFRKAMPPGTTIVDSGYTYVNNRKSVFIKSKYMYRDGDDEISLTIYQAMFYFRGHVYILLFRAPTELFERLFDDFRVLSSQFVLSVNIPKSKK